MKKLLSLTLLLLGAAVSHAQVSPPLPPQSVSGNGSTTATQSAAPLILSGPLFATPPASLGGAGVIGAGQPVEYVTSGFPYPITTADLSNTIQASGALCAFTVPAANASGFADRSAFDIQNTGNTVCSLTPAAGTTIAGIYTNSVPFLVYPQQSCELTDDGISNWGVSLCNAANISAQNKVNLANMTAHDGLTDDSAGLSAAIAIINADAANGIYDCLYAPGGVYYLNGTVTQFAKFVSGCVIGDGKYHTFFKMGASFSGPVFSVSDAWNVTNGSPNDFYNFGFVFNGPRFVGFSITGDIRNSGQAGIEFYDNNDKALFEDLDFEYINGPGIEIGTVLNNTGSSQAYMRDSKCYDLVFNYTGSTSTPAFHIGTSVGVSGDATNEIECFGIRMVHPNTDGLVMDTTNAAGSILKGTDNISLHGISLEGNVNSGDLMRAGGTSNIGTVYNVHVFDYLCTNVTGYCFHLAGTSVTPSGEVGTLNTFTGTATSGTYTGVSLTGGTGSGALGTVTVAGGSVTNVVATFTGSGYVVGDVLSFTVTGGSGTATVHTVSNASSPNNIIFDGFTVVTVGGGGASAIKLDQGKNIIVHGYNGNGSLTDDLITGAAVTCCIILENTGNKNLVTSIATAGTFYPIDPAGLASTQLFNVLNFCTSTCTSNVDTTGAVFTSAMHAALTAALAAGRGTIVVPSGAYIYDPSQDSNIGPLIITSGGIFIVGQGPGSTLITLKTLNYIASLPTGYATFASNDVTFADWQNVITGGMRDIRIFENDSPNVGTMIRIDRSTQTVFDNVTACCSFFSIDNISSGTDLYNDLSTLGNNSSTSSTVRTAGFVSRSWGGWFTSTIDNGSGSSGNILTVTAWGDGNGLAPGTIISASNLPTGGNAPVIVAQTSGTAGQTGTYTLSLNSTTAATAIPTTPFQITPNPPSSGTWASDIGVTCGNVAGFCTAVGNAFTKVSSGPTSGQYSVAAGVYTFAAADNASGITVAISYNFTLNKTSEVMNGVNNSADVHIANSIIRGQGSGQSCSPIWVQNADGIHVSNTHIGFAATANNCADTVVQEVNTNDKVDNFFFDNSVWDGQTQNYNVLMLPYAGAGVYVGSGSHGIHFTGTGFTNSVIDGFADFDPNSGEITITGGKSRGNGCNGANFQAGNIATIAGTEFYDNNGIAGTCGHIKIGGPSVTITPSANVSASQTILTTSTAGLQIGMTCPACNSAYFSNTIYVQNWVSNTSITVSAPVTFTTAQLPSIVFTPTPTNITVDNGVIYGDRSPNIVTADILNYVGAGSGINLPYGPASIADPVGTDLTGTYAFIGPLTPIFTDLTANSTTITSAYGVADPIPNLEVTNSKTVSNFYARHFKDGTCSTGGGGTPTCTVKWALEIDHVQFDQPFTSTVTTGTAPMVIASTTNVPNLNASSLNGATFAAPGPIGSGTPSTIAGTTVVTKPVNPVTDAGNVPSVLFQGGVPFIMVTGCTISTTGALSGCATLPQTYGSAMNAVASALMYFPASTVEVTAATKGVVAGFYWVQMTSATAGQVCNDGSSSTTPGYNGGTPVQPASCTHPTNASNTTFAPGTGEVLGPYQTIAANSMGANGRLFYDSFADTGSDSTAHTINVKFGGSNQASSATTTGGAIISQVYITNTAYAKSQNVRVVRNSTTTTGVNLAVTAQSGYAAIDTTTAQTGTSGAAFGLTIAGTSAAYMVLSSYAVTLSPN